MLKDFFSKISDKEKKKLYFALGILSIAFFDLLFLHPVMKKINEINAQIKDEKNNIKRDLRFLSYHDKIAQEQKVFSGFDTGESKTGEVIMASFFKTIEKLAQDSDILINKSNPGEMIQKKGIILYHANLECVGRMENMIKFMHKIDTTQNLLKIVKMNMAAKKASADEVNVSLKIAKLIIDPKTIGNYQFKEEEMDFPLDAEISLEKILFKSGEMVDVKKEKVLVKGLSGESTEVKIEKSGSSLSGTGQGASEGSGDEKGDKNNQEASPAGGGGGGGGAGSGGEGSVEGGQKEGGVSQGGGSSQGGGAGAGGAGVGGAGAGGAEAGGAEAGGAEAGGAEAGGAGAGGAGAGGAGAGGAGAGGAGVGGAGAGGAGAGGAGIGVPGQGTDQSSSLEDKGILKKDENKESKTNTGDQDEPDDLSTGERFRVEDLRSLWFKFLGKDPEKEALKQQQKKAKKEESQQLQEQEEEEQKPNLLQRLLFKETE